MATPSKKSAAYEKGLREGRADKSKPSIEIEIKPEGEEKEEMGTEEMDGAKSHSRKRSAKGAKNTKAPMDAECGCMSKGRKGKCDGSCGKSMKDGGYMKKMDSLTPQEYLTACELGIQNRSRTYIRARLDAAERLDLKCGKGAISQGEKCSKGAAQKVQPKEDKKFRNSGARKALLVGAAIGGAALLGAGLDIRSQRRRAAGSALRSIKELKAKGNDTLVAALRAGKNLNEMNPNNPLMQQRSYFNILQAQTTRGLARQAAKEGLAELKTKVPKSPARRRAARRRSDSIFAIGFAPELDQLAI